MSCEVLEFLTSEHFNDELTEQIFFDLLNVDLVEFEIFTDKINCYKLDILKEHIIFLDCEFGIKKNKKLNKKLNKMYEIVA